MEAVSVVPVEVRCRPPRVDSAELSKVITSFIRQHHINIRPGDVLSLGTASDLITSTVELLRVCDVFCPQHGVAADGVDYALLMYSLHIAPRYDEPLHNTVLSADEGEGLSCCSLLPLPNASLEGLWESLFYGETLHDSVQLKRDLLQYMRTSMLFSMADVNPHMVTWNRLLLFHGPPGTGKTSLCRALAHKLAIRLGDIFASAQLIEINAHSLFSRWFSESGKQVMLLFKRIHDLADEPSCLLCVLVDEVESLAAARRSALKGNEPSDAIRVVNALLTQLDSLQWRKNVVVLATSNITGAIDVAFIDRADKKLFIGPPGMQARFALLKSSTEEMLRRGLVRSTLSFNGEFAQEERWPVMEARNDRELSPDELQQLELVARQCEAFSGRTMRKLPFLAYSAHVRGARAARPHAISFAMYMAGMLQAVQSEVCARVAMTSS